MRKLIIGVAILYSLLLAVLYFFQDKIIFHETVLDENYKFEFPYPFKEIWIDVENENEPKSQVNAIYFYTDLLPKKGLIVYFHGNARDLNRAGKFAPDFTKNGYDILMIDYRGYGKSRGEFSEKGLISDSKAAYNYAKTLFPENKLVVYGKSLGSGIATQITASNNPKLLLLETPYFNFPDVAGNFFPFIPFKTLSKYQFQTDKFIKKVKCPIHLFHGDNDGLVYYESSIKLAKLLGKKPTEILTTIKGGEHRNLSKFPEYHAALDSCLAK
jgi:uncharacterized protein